MLFTSLRVPKSFTTQSFEYYELVAKDKLQAPIYEEPVLIENVRIDYSTVFSRDTRETKVVANAVIFCFAGVTSPFPDFKEESKVIFGSKKHIIKKVILNQEPTNSAVFSYELEVL